MRIDDRFQMFLLCSKPKPSGTTLVVYKCRLVLMEEGTAYFFCFFFFFFWMGLRNCLISSVQCLRLFADNITPLSSMVNEFMAFTILHMAPLSCDSIHLTQHVYNPLVTVW